MVEFLIAILVLIGYALFYAVISATTYVAYKILQHEQQKKNQDNTAAELQPPVK